jgi:predicted NBD/HSP70 family sugar kinase
VSTTGFNQDEIRRHNLGAVLSQLHVHGALTRAELATRLGLNRTTIRALTADLTTAGVVREQTASTTRDDAPAGSARAGRPSHLVVPCADDVAVLAIDLGVEHLTVSRVGLGGLVLDRRTSRHARGHQNVSAVVEAVGRMAGDLSSSRPPLGAAIAVPAVVNEPDGMVRFAPNLGWTDEPLGTMLAKRLGLTVLVGNDGDLGAIAEHKRGAATGFADAIYLRGDVGVGGGFIVGGKPLRGRGGYAGEVGHLVVNPSGKRCLCGARGCLETEVGENALLIAAGRLPGGGIEGVREVIASAEAGEEHAANALMWASTWLGRGVGSLVNLFNPAVVILGGVLAEMLSAARPDIEREMGRWSMLAPREQAQLTLPELGEDSVLLGAAELAFAPLLDDPQQLLTR